MHSLTKIIAMNSPAACKARAARAENETTRHCSFCVTPKGVVLHSAKQRNTAYVHNEVATRFLEKAKRLTKAPVSLDTLIESYFA